MGRKSSQCGPESSPGALGAPSQVPWPTATLLCSLSALCPGSWELPQMGRLGHCGRAEGLDWDVSPGPWWPRGGPPGRSFQALGPGQAGASRPPPPLGARVWASRPLLP